MTVLSSVAPALREVRAPLIAGYLWLACGWLVLEPVVPVPGSNEIYERVAELGAAIGPVGLAATASIAAYLIGSLVRAAVQVLWRRLTHNLRPLRMDEQQQERFETLAQAEKPLDIEMILQIADPFQEAVIKRPFLGDAPLDFSVWEMAERELMDSFRRLQHSVETVQHQIGSKAVCDFRMHARTPLVLLPIMTEAGPRKVEHEIPHLLPSRDLLDQMPLLETRLLEIAENTGNRIEQLQAEADFRLTISLPMGVLALIFGVAVSPLWFLALVIPAALTAQGVELSRRSAEELVDALRARSQTPELEQITPVFQRYRAFATKLTEGIGDANWTR